jgi:electron transport complex protein RnfG
MKKLESTFINMLISLTLVALAAGVSLAYMNELTKGPKEEARKLKKLNAIKSVLPEITNDPFTEKISYAIEGEKDSMDFYPGKSNGEMAGMAIATYTNKGYSGLIRLMAGFDMEGNIVNIAVLEQKETPGLGTKITTESFVAQYLGKNPGKMNMTVKKDGGEIDAITGATITTRAYNHAVQRAYDRFMEEKDSFLKASN